MARGADRARYEAILAGGPAGDLGGLGVDLQRVLPEAPFVQLEPAGLEGVGLDDAGARVEHRSMHAFDHVGAVEHERLVTLALQPAVVVRAQVELLERRPHPTVEDDDVVSYRG